MELEFLLLVLVDLEPRPATALGELEVIDDPEEVPDLIGWTGTALIRADSETSWVMSLTILTAAARAKDVYLAKVAEPSLLFKL